MKSPRDLDRLIGSMDFTAHSLDDTAAFARTLATRLRPGDVLTLEGDLGAGKTTFTRLLVEALGGAARDVSSPTFVLLNIYETPRCKVFHLDAYRIGPDDLEAIGFDELLEERALVIVEWPSRVQTALPAKRIEMMIETLSQTGRRFVVRGL